MIDRAAADIIAVRIAAGLGLAFLALTLGAYWWPLAILLVISSSVLFLSRIRFFDAAFLLGAYVVLAFGRNLFLSWWMGDGSELTGKTILQGLDLLLLAFVSSWWLLARMLAKDSYAEIWLFPSVLLIILLYSFYGMSLTDFGEVAVYARLTCYFLLAYMAGKQLGIDCRHVTNIVTNLLIVLGVISAIFVLAEVLFPQFIYSIFGIPEYLSSKYGVVFSSPGEVVEFNTRRAFNLPSYVTFHLLRPMGLMLHTPSSAYLMASAAVVIFAKGRIVLGLVVFLSVLLTGAKGPILVCALATWGLLVAIGVWGYRVYFLHVLTVVICLLAVGLFVEDVHTISLLSSINEFWRFPFGSGLGVSGSVGWLIEVGQQGWSVRGDSAAAVLISMLGIPALLVGASYLKIFTQTARSHGVDAKAAGSWMVALVLGIVFQEEALAPAACGLIFILAGTCRSDVSENEGADSRDVLRQM